ncbi:MAG: hypothetical protein EOP35_00145 [Rubrivivax sp.]|nr:MAG: hypothetical protein EOP35_00145 [Rubrivivax sp.]
MPTRSTRQDFDEPPGAALRYLAEAMVLGSLLLLGMKAFRAKHRHRRSGRCARAPEGVNTWEGEGGRPLPDER